MLGLGFGYFEISSSPHVAQGKHQHSNYLPRTSNAMTSRDGVNTAQP